MKQRGRVEVEVEVDGVIVVHGTTAEELVGDGEDGPSCTLDGTEWSNEAISSLEGHTRPTSLATRRYNFSNDEFL